MAPILRNIPNILTISMIVLAAVFFIFFFYATKLENFSSSSYGLGLQLEKIFSSQDRFSFNLSQPLRLTSGGASFFIPTGRTRYKDIIFEEFYQDITPSGVEIDLELVYESPLLGGTLYTRFNILKDRGHLETNKLDHFFETRWEMLLH